VIEIDLRRKKKEKTNKVEHKKDIDGFMREVKLRACFF